MLYTVTSRCGGGLKIVSISFWWQWFASRVCFLFWNSTLGGERETESPLWGRRVEPTFPTGQIHNIKSVICTVLPWIYTHFQQGFKNFVIPVSLYFMFWCLLIVVILSFLWPISYALKMPEATMFSAMLTVKIQMWQFDGKYVTVWMKKGWKVINKL